MGTHLRLLSESNLKNTNMTEFQCFSKIVVLCMKVASELEGFKVGRYSLIGELNIYSSIGRVKKG